MTARNISVPAAEKAEARLLRACVEGKEMVAVEVVDRITGSPFFNNEHAEAWQIVRQLVCDGGSIDYPAFGRAWKAKDPERVLPRFLLATDDELELASIHNWPLDLEDVQAAYKKRRLVFALDGAARDVAEPGADLDAILATVAEELESVDSGQSVVLDGKGCAHVLTDYLEERHELQGKRSGIETGFGYLDEVTDGLQTGCMTVIGARPSQGKTAIGLNIVQHACITAGTPSLIITLEMSGRAIMARMAASGTGIPLKDLQRGNLREPDFARLAAFNTTLAKAPLWVIDQVSQGMRIDELAAAVRRESRLHGIKLVLVDYLQIVDPVERHDMRTYEIAKISKALKGAAVSADVAMLVLAQLNRETESRKDEGPRLSDLADCGQIERDADTVALIHRPKTEDDPQGLNTKLIVAKQRDGETGIVNLHFNGPLVRFENVGRRSPIDEEDIPR